MDTPNLAYTEKLDHRCETPDTRDEDDGPKLAKVRLRSSSRSRRLHVASASLAMVALVPTLARPGQAERLEPHSCYHATLSSDLPWPTSGVEIADTASPGFAVVDAAEGKVFALDGQGWTRELPISRGTKPPLDELRQIRPAVDGYLAMRLAHPDRPELFRVDRHFHVRDEVALPPEIVAIYDFVELSPGLLAFGDLQGPEPAAALFYLAPDGRMEVFQRFPLFNDNDTLNETIYNYTTDNTTRFLASIDGEGFMLFREQPARIGRVRPGVPGVDFLRSFPADFLYFPAVASQPAWQEAESYHGPALVRAFLGIVEDSRAPIGIFGQSSDGSNALYLQVKTARDARTGTLWWLLRLDPQTGEELGRLPIPARPDAAHLTVIPPSQHQEFWGFVERQATIGLRSGSEIAPYSLTRSMTLIPAAWLHDSVMAQPDAQAKARFSCENLSLR